MTIEKLNTILTSSGVGIFITGLVLMFVLAFHIGIIVMIVGMAISIVGATMFRPS